MYAQHFSTGSPIQVARLAASALTLLFASNTFATALCDAPASLADRAACSKAKEGPAELQRYVWRTRAVYQLYFWDYMTPGDVDRYHARQLAQASPQVVAGK